MSRLISILITCLMVHNTLADLIIIYEDLKFSFVDEEYISISDIYVTDENTLAVNFTLKKKLPDDSRIHLYMMSQSMGEYIVPSSLDVDMPLCEALDEPIILGRILEVFGFNADNCPPSPGVYGCESYSVPLDTLPDSYLPNKYLTKFDLYTSKEKLAAIDLYMEIQ